MVSLFSAAFGCSFDLPLPSRVQEIQRLYL